MHVLKGNVMAIIIDLKRIRSSTLGAEIESRKKLYFIVASIAIVIKVWDGFNGFLLNIWWGERWYVRDCMFYGLSGCSPGGWFVLWPKVDVMFMTLWEIFFLNICKFYTLILKMFQNVTRSTEGGFRDRKWLKNYCYLYTFMLAEYATVIFYGKRIIINSFAIMWIKYEIKQTPRVRS